MIGAMIGDIIGSVYEFKDNVEDKNFKFKNFIKKTRNENFTINFDILFNLECNSELNVKKVIGQNSQRLNLFIKNTIDEYKSKIKTSFSSEFLEKYKEIVEEMKNMSTYLNEIITRFEKTDYKEIMQLITEFTVRNYLVERAIGTL